MAFTQKMLSFTFQMENGQFGSGSGGNTGTITGLQASVKIVNAGGAQMAALEAAIFGMSLDQMSQFSTVGTQMNTMNHNSITVDAGDADSGMSTVFGGTISLAYVDAQSQPQVCFRVTAHAGYREAGMAIAPTTQQGSADVSQLMSQLAGQMGLAFEDAGVSVKVSNPYLPGTARQQVKRLAQAAGCDWSIDRNTLIICPADKARSGNSIIVSPQTGMVSYPMFNSAGIVVQCLHNPDIAWKRQVTVQSQLTQACGDWQINNVSYDLECLTPKGKWFDTFEASRIGVGNSAGDQG